MTVAKFWEEL